MQNADWMKHKLETILLGEISIASGIQMTQPLWLFESGGPSIGVSALTSVLQFHHFMANRWGNNDSDRLYFLGFQNHYRW